MIGWLLNPIHQDLNQFLKCYSLTSHSIPPCSCLLQTLTQFSPSSGIKEIVGPVSPMLGRTYNLTCGAVQKSGASIDFIWTREGEARQAGSQHTSNGLVSGSMITLRTVFIRSPLKAILSMVFFVMVEIVFIFGLLQNKLYFYKYHIIFIVNVVVSNDFT